ncbi:MAG: hypothetical protein A3F17_07295 [Gammaproteobacteria bacterium RIFCSPHIGHO2_12_FULL_41_15]|nr:MAG: hypothetical protein A3F17_07295 [Gammaproteobacteria bacterium RIFCSPHIGHO2_12_FULL_41_15]
MNMDEFAWLWQGIVKKKFTKSDKHYLDPINIRRKKNGRAILLLHGFSSSPAVFRHIVPACALYDAISAPVLPGHGLSIAAFAKVTGEEWLNNAKAEYQKLALDYAKVDVLGLSLGGLLALHIATLYKPHHLYLLAPALLLNFPLNLGPRLPNFLAKIGIKTIRSQGGNIHQRYEAELTYKRLPLTTITEVINLIHSFNFKPPTCPTDVFLGKYDATVNSGRIALLFKNLPNANIHWLNHSAHVLPLDEDKNLINNLIQTNLLKG